MEGRGEPERAQASAMKPCAIDRISLLRSRSAGM